MNGEVMRYFVNRTVIALLCLILTAGLAGAQTTDRNTPLTNADVVKLVRAGFKEKSIVSIIDARPAAFDLSPDRMIELKHTGVSEHIILAMLSRQQGMSAFDAAWDDDSLFEEKHDKAKEKGKPDAQNQVDIFGSGSSAQSSTRSRGGNQGVSGETETTGPATVRIIRPPSESGGAPIKLEKTPSLRNDSIIELVEAGFSEGTIVRRIEQSPVDFDLSTTQIANLRKHQVSDKVLTAMKTAMGDDSTSKSGTQSNGTSRP
jgi:hypothetical protein